MNPLHILVVVSSGSQFVFLTAQFTLLLYALHLQVSPILAGLLVSLGGLGPAVISISIGKLIDRRGGRWPMLVALAGQIVGAMLPLLWGALPGLFAASFVNGITFIVYRIASQQIAGRTGRAEDRAANYGLLGLGYSSSSIAAPLCAGFSIDHYGHAPTFLWITLMALLPLAAVAFKVLHIPGPVATPAATPGGGMFELLARPKLRRILITTVLMNGAWDVFNFLIPLYGSQLHLAASQIGLLSSAFAFGALFVRATTVLVLRRFSAWQMLIMALVLSGASFLAYPALELVPLLLAVAFLAGMGIGAALPVTMALSFEAAPIERAGEFIGIRLALSMASTATLPLLCGALGASLGIALVYWIEGSALMAGAWANRRQWRQARLRDQA